MSFTDEDVALLKRTLFHKCDGEDKVEIPFNGSPYEKMKALLARLEAAEKAARWFNALKVEDQNSEPYKDYLAWRKSCGS